MKIDSIKITNFRNLKSVSIEFGHRLNIFYGQNGSGKTSFLEAIHYLGLGRSFRTRHLSRIINHEAPSFSIFAQLAQHNNASSLPIGIERQKEITQYSIKIGGKPACSLVEAAKILPLQFINVDSHLLLTAGPLARRQFLDWGVFHVEPAFYHYWQRANRIIKQRNAGLKSASSYSEIALWDDELAQCAIQLDIFRRNYIELFTPILYPMLGLLLERSDFKLVYFSGWNNKQSLKNIYRLSFDRDKQLGYTQQGPHRADLQLKIKGIAAQDILSQGQQKLSAYSLRLAQGKLFNSNTHKECLFLIDDLPSELDASKRRLIANIILSLEAQTVITGIEMETLSDLLAQPDTKRFHVKHGAIISI